MADTPFSRSPLRPVALLATALVLVAAPLSAVAADHLRLGQAALADDLPAEAERHLVSYLAANQATPGKCPGALLLLLRAVADQGRPRDVLALLEANADIVSNSPPTRIAYWRARSHLELGQSAKALSIVTAHLPAGAAIGSVPAGRPPDAEMDATDLALLLRLQARALAETPGSEDKATLAFRKADEALSLPMFTEMKAANLYEWARHEFAAGHSQDSSDLLARLDALSPSLTNSPSLPLEQGVLLRAELLTGEGRTPVAVPLLCALATNTTATLRNRAEATLALATIAAVRERTDGHAEGVVKPPADYADAIATFAGALPPEDACDLNRRFGRILLSAPSSIPLGAEVLSREIRRNPAAPDAPADQLAIADGWLSISSNELAAAEYLAYLEAYHGDSGESLAALEGRATALSRIGRYDEAATLFQKTAEATTDPNREAMSLLLAARTFRSGEKYERAASLFSRAAEVSGTTNPPLWIQKARFDAADAYERAGNLENAEKSFLEIAGRREPSSGADDLSDRALYRTATIRDRLGKIGQAIAAYSELIKRASDEELRNAALLGRGRDYYGNFKFQDAIRDFARVDKGYPEIAAEAAYYRLFCLYATNQDADAVREAKAFLDQRPDSKHLPSVVMWLAQYHYNRRDFEQAQSVFTDYSRRWPRSPDTPKALLWGATAAFERSEYQQSIDLLSFLLSTSPGSEYAGEARFLQAKALCNLARFEDAILALDDVIHRYPVGEFVTDAWILFGDALFASASSPASRERYREAREAYSAAKARCKTTKTPRGVIPADEDFDRYLEASFKIGRCLGKEGKLIEARRHFYDDVILPYLEATQKGVFPGREASAWFAKGVFQTADLLEHEANLDAAISVLRHLERSELPERDQAGRGIRRLETLRLQTTR